MTPDKKGSLPLHCAIRAGNLPVVQLLLTKDPEKQVRVQDTDGNTPMHLAAQKGLAIYNFFTQN
jgi:ankyrin repeat protein